MRNFSPEYWIELLRPWKFGSFLMGTAFFVWGAYYWAVPTWDVRVSVLMSVLCYALAPWSVERVVASVQRRSNTPWWDTAAGAAVIYFVASGSYEIYNTLRMGQHPVTYWYNLGFSVPVTIMAGLIWRYEGTLLELLREIRRALGTRRAT